MNELHLQYKRETGKTPNDYSWMFEIDTVEFEENLNHIKSVAEKNNMSLAIDADDLIGLLNEIEYEASQLPSKEYIKWLEEKYTELRKRAENAKLFYL